MRNNPEMSQVKTYQTFEIRGAEFLNTVKERGVQVQQRKRSFESAGTIYTAVPLKYVEPIRMMLKSLGWDIRVIYRNSKKSGMNGGANLKKDAEWAKIMVGKREYHSETYKYSGETHTWSSFWFDRYF